MEYESYQNGDLEVIISKKRESDIREEKDLLFQEDIMKILKKQGFENHPFFNEDHEKEERQMEEFFDEKEEGVFRFDSKQAKKGEANTALSEEIEESEEEKNIEKVGKWFGGMCQKCLCCFKSKHAKHSDAHS
jgi:hypothetical protein